MEHAVIALYGRKNDVPTLAFLDGHFKIVNEQELSLDEVIHLDSTTILSGKKEKSRVLFNNKLDTIKIPLEARLRVAEEPSGSHYLIVLDYSASWQQRSEKFEKEIAPFLAFGLLATPYETGRVMARDLFKRDDVGMNVGASTSEIYTPQLKMLNSVDGTLIGYTNTAAVPHWVTLNEDSTRLELRDIHYKILQEKNLDGNVLEAVIVPRNRILAVSVSNEPNYLLLYEWLNEIFTEASESYKFTHLTPLPFDKRTIIAYAIQDDVHFLEKKGDDFITEKSTSLENDDYASMLRRMEPINLDGKNFLVAENAAGEIVIFDDQFKPVRDHENPNYNLYFKNLGYKKGDNYFSALKNLEGKDYFRVQYGISIPKIFNSSFERVQTELTDGITDMAVVQLPNPLLAVTLTSHIELYSPNFKKIKSISFNRFNDISHIVPL